MAALGLIILPLVAAVLACLVRSERRRPILLPTTAVVQVALAAIVLARPELGSAGAWLGVDPPGRVVLAAISVLYLMCSVYSVGYLRARPDQSNRVFCACCLALLGTMSFVIFARHVGLMWVAIETTTLATAPLIYFNRTQRSLEAVWKYLLVGSVGIAIALLGTLFLGYSALHAGLESSLLFDALLVEAPQLSKPWLHTAFILALVGYGTKMGIAPMHTWKPDAYGEAPGVVGALLAGGPTNCAFLALLRIYHICDAAGEGAFAGRLLVFMGLASMAVAGVFMAGQRDFKRMLAYSSVEHMGILILGIGLGGSAVFGSLLHLVNNALTKGVVFLSAGNIHRAFGSKSTDLVRGALRRVPLSGAMFLAGFLAITGSPPFGPFVSEFTILNGAFDRGRFVSGGLYLLFLMLVFVGMGSTVLKVVQGRPLSPREPDGYKDGILTGLPIVCLLALVLMLGLVIPGPLDALLRNAAAFIESHP